MRVLRKVVINPVNRSTPAEIEILQQAVDTFSEERAAELAAQFAEDGTWQVPTLIRLRTQYLCDAPEFSEDPDLQYMAESTTKTWQDATGTFVEEVPAAIAGDLPRRLRGAAADDQDLQRRRGADAGGQRRRRRRLGGPGTVAAPRVRRAGPGRPARRCASCR